MNKENKKYLAEELKSYLEIHFRERLKLGQISKEFSISTNDLTKTFKMKYHKSIVDYIIELRIEYAKKLLREDQETIHDIAKMSGYTTISNFNRQFKEITNLTPAEYRKSIYANEKEKLGA